MYTGRFNNPVLVACLNTGGISLSTGAGRSEQIECGNEHRHSRRLRSTYKPGEQSVNGPTRSPQRGSTHN